MANTSRPEGFKPYGEPKRTTSYNATGTIYPGDPVKIASDGGLVVAAAGDACIGVAASYATTGGFVLVWDDPQQLFVAEMDDGTFAALTDLNLNYNFVAATASTAFKCSRAVLDASTKATDSNLPFKALFLDPRDNNAYGSKAKVVCKINNHSMSGGTGTVGI
jgi:hypothetical protein